MLLLQHGATVDATTKDLYTPLHIAAKEGQEEVIILLSFLKKYIYIYDARYNFLYLQVASVLLEHGASLNATTKKGFTPLHLAAKYGNIKVAKLLLQKDVDVDAQGKVCFNSIISIFITITNFFFFNST